MPDGSLNAAPVPETERASTQKDQREVSTIAFPYHTLEDAIDLARTILEKGAVPMARDQLAAATGLKLGSGNFTNKISAARVFGLIDSAAGKSQLTRLGFEILDKNEARAKAARVQAFFNVPLFRRTYDEFRNSQLPPRPHGLEAAFGSFGVAAKQKERVRRVFDHSAKLAGFFEHGDDRLVEPVIAPVSERIEARREPAHPEAEEDAEEGRNRDRSGEISENHHFIQGLLDELPMRIGDQWSHVERYKWLQLASQCFDMLYKPGEDGTGEIKITLAWRGAKSKPE